ncbi:MAG: GntR family transcriptional regulator [Spirochaetes bacterium]|nr:GntR family transcriptional regulator [Spirochaetota bacterium]
MQFQPFQKKQTLAEQIAEQIKESILTGEIKAGEALPTEPELAQQFQVSRSVIRDAARILLAWGLVDIQHGKGMFITESGISAFCEAVLIALRRQKASVWDVEETERIIYPQVCAMACQMGSAEEKLKLQEKADQYNKNFSDLNWKLYQEKREEYPEEQRHMDELANNFKNHIYQMAGNKLLYLLGSTVQHLRKARNWHNPDHSTPTKENIEQFIQFETSFMQKTVDLIKSNDPEKAASIIKKMMGLPKVAYQAMKDTPIGQMPKIPMTPQAYQEFLEKRNS